MHRESIVLSLFAHFCDAYIRLFTEYSDYKILFPSNISQAENFTITWMIAEICKISVH